MNTIERQLSNQGLFPVYCRQITVDLIAFVLVGTQARNLPRRVAQTVGV